MMIAEDDVNELYNEVLHWAKVGERELTDTRGGKVYRMDEPLTICNRVPTRRVLFNPMRNANPFFHLMEAVWMFAGKDDLWITKFNKNMAQFADANGTFHGAYGARWLEQIGPAVEMLIKDPKSRRVYVSLWDARKDLQTNSNDLPCNVGISFQTRRGKLEAHVFNRSNDIIWGMLGSNIVHFSMLQEVVAHLSGLPLGPLYQISVNAHYYDRHFGLVKDHISEDKVPYPRPYPLHPQSWRTWVSDCRRVLEGTSNCSMYHHDFFPDVVLPMIALWEGHGKAQSICAPDWRKAAQEWIERNRHGKQVA